MAEVMNLDPSTGNPVESKRIADANKRAEEAPFHDTPKSKSGWSLYNFLEGG